MNKEKIIRKNLKNHELYDAEAAAMESIDFYRTNFNHDEPLSSKDRSYLKSYIEGRNEGFKQKRFDEAYRKRQNERKKSIEQELSKGVFQYYFSYERRTKSLTIIAVVIALLALFFVRYQDFHKHSVEQKDLKNNITTSNTETKVTVDNTFSILLPCNPEGQPYVMDDNDFKSTTVSCSEKDSTGSPINTYSAAHSVYKTNKYSPTDEALSCADTTDDSSGVKVNFHVIDNHVEDVHGLHFATCDLEGDDGTVQINAKVVSGNSVVRFGYTSDDAHSKNIWPKFRGYLESFNFVQ